MEHLLYLFHCPPNVLKADIYSANVSRASDAFNLHLRQTKCSVYLTFVLFTKEKQPLKVFGKIVI